MISKVVEMRPQGVLKLSIKQDEYDVNRDNVDERVCDFYTDEGNVNPQPPKSEESSEGTSSINYMEIDEDGFLQKAQSIDKINVAKTYYFAEDKTVSDFEAYWRIRIDGKELGDPLEKLVTLSEVDKYTVSLRLAKSSKLYGQTIVLSLTDENGDYYSSIKLEVTK